MIYLQLVWFISLVHFSCKSKALWVAAPDLQADWDRTQNLFGSDIPAGNAGGKCKTTTSSATLRRPFPAILWNPWKKESFTAPHSALAGRWLCPQLPSPAFHRNRSLCPLHTRDSSVLQATITHRLQEWEQPLGQRQMGEGMQVEQEEAFEVHTGMKKLCFFLLPLKDSTT